MNYQTIQFASLEEVTEHPLKPVMVMVIIHSIKFNYFIIYNNNICYNNICI